MIKDLQFNCLVHICSLCHPFRVAVMSVRKEKYGSKKGEEGHEEKNNGFSFELECGEKAEKDLLTAVREGEGEGEGGKREGGSSWKSWKLEAGSSSLRWSWTRVEKMPGLGIGFIFLTVLLYQVLFILY